MAKTHVLVSGTAASLLVICTEEYVMFKRSSGNVYGYFNLCLRTIKYTVTEYVSIRKNRKTD